MTLTVTSARGCTATATTTVSGVVATKEVAGLTALKIFPNPFHSSTSVEFALKNQTMLDVQLVGVTGRAIPLASQEFDAGLNRQEIGNGKYDSVSDKKIVGQKFGTNVSLGFGYTFKGG